MFLEFLTIESRPKLLKDGWSTGTNPTLSDNSLAPLGCAYDNLCAHTMALSSPPTITIYLPAPLRAYSGGATELSLSARTVRGVLEHLEQSHSALYRNVCDETGAVRRHLNIFVNSDNVRDLDGVDTILTPGDVVTIVPAVSGG